MNITGQYNFISTLAGRQYHCLYRACCTSYHQKCMCCSKSICCQFFRFPYYRYRMTEVVQWFHAVDIHPYTFLSQKFCQFRIASSSFMTRNIKRYNSHSSESLQSLMYRCMILVQFKTTSFHHSSISSFLCFNPQSTFHRLNKIKKAGRALSHKPAFGMYSSVLFSAVTEKAISSLRFLNKTSGSCVSESI